MSLTARLSNMEALGFLAVDRGARLPEESECDDSTTNRTVEIKPND